MYPCVRNSKATHNVNSSPNAAQPENRLPRISMDYHSVFSLLLYPNILFEISLKDHSAFVTVILRFLVIKYFTYRNRQILDMRSVGLLIKKIKNNVKRLTHLLKFNNICVSLTFDFTNPNVSYCE